jgi:hypothetical protein
MSTNGSPSDGNSESKHSLRPITKLQLNSIEQQFGRASEQYQNALAAYVEAVETEIDSDDEQSTDTESDDDMSEDEALQLAEELNQPGGQPSASEPTPAPAPAPAAARPGSGAIAVTRQLDLEARAEAANALRNTPGIMKLIEARIFKFDDFLTNGSLDMRKLAKVRRVLAKRVDSTAESYALAARAKGYAPSGAAFPVTGLRPTNVSKVLMCGIDGKLDLASIGAVDESLL